MDNERVSQQVLEKMEQEAIGLSVFKEHEHHIDNILGKIISTELKQEGLYISAEILPERQEEIKKLLDNNINFGFSIGGFATFDNQGKGIITDYKLLEVSVVALPANWNSFGTIYEDKTKSVTCSCLYAGLTELHKNMELNMSEKEIVSEENKVSSSEVTEKLKAVEVTEEEEEKEEEKAIEEPVEDAPFVTREEIGAILDEFMAEKEEQIKADILATLEAEAPEEKAEEPEEEEAEAEPPVEEEKAEEEEEEEEPEEEKEEEEEEEKPVSKYASYNEETTTKNTSFLDSETRDYLGRNRKYL